VAGQAYTAQQATGDTTVARALVSRAPFSARYDLDRRTGVISRLGHPLRGESVAGRILISRTVQGGVAAGWALLAMAGRGIGLAGLIFGDTNPVMVQGAVAAGIPVMAGIEAEFFAAVRTGDRLRLDPASRVVVVLDRSDSAGRDGAQTRADPREGGGG
jgi:predicted aconitase with swiveling domain